MVKKMTWFCVLLLGLSVVAHAQEQPGVNCVPVQGNGWEGCAPLPNSNQPPQQPAPMRPRWADRWGATAIADGSSTLPSSFGAATDMPTKAAAEAAALAQCQNTPNAKCSIDQTYHNQCIAVSWGKKIAISYTAATLSTAKELSMASCKAHDDTQCVLYYSACSYPVRVQ